MTIVTILTAGLHTVGPRFQIGHFALHTVGELSGCKWREDLWNPELSGTIYIDQGEILIRHFAHAEDTFVSLKNGDAQCWR